MWGLLGQDRAVEVLRRGVATDRLSHAYLLTGLPRAGKSTLALALAQALNCREANPPCLFCRSCRLIARGGHPDVRSIEVGQASRNIKFEEITALQRDAALRPLEGRYKVYMILEAERMNQTAANQLLKTLEEPPDHVIVVLTASDSESLLPTLVSRCQEVQLGLVPTPLLKDHLERQVGVEPDRADLIARLADGRPGWALEAARDPTLMDERNARLDDLHQMLDGDRLMRLQVSRSLAERWSSRRQTVRDALRGWIGWWRDLALLQADLDSQVVNVDERDELRQEARRFGAGAASRAMARLEQALDDLELNVSPRLALDVALLGLPVRERAR
jgi:DNA polymerase-3 subunit delta'